MTAQPATRIAPTAASAPGKLVLWGEYAVLVGARAGVLAVDRFAHCLASPNSEGGDSANNQWQITTQGFTSEPLTLDSSWFASPSAPKPSHPGALLWHAARANHWLPSQSARLHIDSSAFYHESINGQTNQPTPAAVKLGLGSSAAVCTALTHLCAELKAASFGSTNILPTFPSALAAHRAAQAGAGSGIDVAASALGGLLAYELTDSDTPEASTTQPLTTPLSWPSDLHWQAFWTGTAASTTDHLKRFDTWRRLDDTRALTALVAASNHCSESLSLAALTQYVAALRQFDAASQIGIYAQGHENLHKLASRIGVIYKPCGAGGGDLGVAFAADPDQLQQFASAAAADNIVQIRLEMAKHGVRTQAGNHQPDF